VLVTDIPREGRFVMLAKKEPPCLAHGGSQRFRTRGNTHSRFAAVEQPVRVQLVGSNRAEAFGLVTVGRAPLCQLCRKLIRAGIKADLPVEAYRGDVLALRARSLLMAAQLTAKDDVRGTPRFERYRPPAAGRPAVVGGPASRTAQNRSEAPGPLPAENNASCEAPGKLAEPVS
jgi:hypothetical protein